MLLRLFHGFGALLLSASCLRADVPTPTVAAGQYDSFPGCTFDYWQVPGKPDAPLIIMIHGGGFIHGFRQEFYSLVEPLRKKGYAMMTIDYPFLQNLPVQQVLHYCGRAVQYARSHAAEWKFDPKRIVVIGGSAGAGAALWIAVHPDLADPKASDPIARTSSRVSAVGLLDTQSTYNVYRWRKIMGYPESLANLDCFAPVCIYHFANNDGTPPDSPEVRSMLQDVDMFAMIDAATPPLIVRRKYNEEKKEDWIHHTRHSEAIIEQAKQFGVVTDFKVLPEEGPDQFLDIVNYFDTHPVQPVSPK